MTISLRKAEENRNIRNLLGIPNEYYDLELIFPIVNDHNTSGDRQLHPKYHIASNIATIGGCPSLSSDHGSDATSHDSPRIETGSAVPQSDKESQLSQVPRSSLSGLSLRPGLAAPSEEVEEVDSTYSATSLDSFISDGMISEDKTDEEFEQPSSIRDLVLAAFRGEPDLLPDVFAILHGESEGHRQAAADARETSTSQPSKDTTKARRGSSKRRRAADGDDGTPHDEGSRKARPRIAHNNTKILAQLKFGCAFHKMFPLKYCIHTSIGGPDDFYQPCSGTGWTEIRHLVKHYAEKHGRPQCLNCLDIFVDTQALTRHLREGHCIQSLDRSKEEPIDPAVMERIKQACSNARAETPWSKEEIKWYKICFILFPLSVPPNSPHAGQEAEIRLLRVVMDSLENRIQAEPNSHSSTVIRNVINVIQDVYQTLGPAIEESRTPNAAAFARETREETNVPQLGIDEGNITGQPESSQSSDDTQLISSSHYANIDPRILLLDSTDQIHLMPDQETGEHMTDQPPSETWMHTGQSEDSSPGTFPGSGELFEDSSTE